MPIRGWRPDDVPTYGGRPVIRGPLHLPCRHSRLAALVSLLIGLAVVMPAAAGAVGPNQRRDGRAPFDVDSTAANTRRVVTPPAPRRAAAAAMRRALGRQAQVQLDRVTGTPREVAKLDGFLDRTVDEVAPADRRARLPARPIASCSGSTPGTSRTCG